MNLSLKFTSSLILLSLLSALTIFHSRQAMAIEEPKFDQIKEFETYELRKYPPNIVAEVYVDGSRDEASNKGFRKIANFIFGNNTGMGSESKIAMTVPVSVEPVKIAMTVPVTIQATSSVNSPSATPITSVTNNMWRVEFVMPSQYTLATLPKPKNDEVKIQAIPEKYYAVIRFSGFISDKSVMEQTELLNTWIAKEGLSAVGAPRLSRYNPPWSLPFLRRNEVLIEVKPL